MKIINPIKIINPMQMAIIKKDFIGIASNKRLFSVLLIVPLMFTVVIPSIFILTIYFAPEEAGDLHSLLRIAPALSYVDSMSRALTALIFNYIIPVFFMLIPIMAASVMAASSFVGEKEKRTLETLLYCPLSMKQIFQAKVWASFLMSMTVSFISFFIMLIVVETEIVLMYGNLLIPGINWLVAMLVVSPAVSLLAITLIVGGSAKAQSVEESQQRAVFLVLPVILLAVSQFTGIILINTWYLLAVGAIFAAFAYVLMRRSLRNFTYEILLR